MWLRVAVLTIVGALASADCPDGFDDLGLGGYLCYKFVTDQNFTWTNAFISCMTSTPNANLVSVAEPADFYPLSFYARQTGADMWTGLIDIAGSKSWADDSPYNPALDQFIANMSSSGAIYGYLSAQDGLFHIDAGTATYGYICYVDTTPASTTTPTPTTTATSTTPAPPACDADWVHYNQTCYLLSSDTEYWAAASHSCHEQDAEPMSVHDHGLLTFLLLQTKGFVYWIGLQAHNGTYVYEDGSATDDVDQILGPYMDQWMEDRNCIAMNATNYPYAVIHQSCFEKLQYTCYKPARPGSQPVYPDLDETLLYAAPEDDIWNLMYNL